MKWLLIFLSALPLVNAATVSLFDGKTLDGWEMPAGWFLSVNALLILILAVPVSALCLGLALAPFIRRLMPGIE